MIKINLLPQEEKYESISILKNLEERFRIYTKELRVQRKNAPELSAGDKIYDIHYHSAEFIGRFRRGSIHGINNKRWINGLRHPQTTQERRLNTAYIGYTRGKRRYLPTTWDDMYRSDQKWEAGVSWKHRIKARHQWGGNNKRFTETLEG